MLVISVTQALLLPGALILSLVPWSSLSLFRLKVTYCSVELPPGFLLCLRNISIPVLSSSTLLSVRLCVCVRVCVCTHLCVCV